jgi:galactokinase
MKSLSNELKISTPGRVCLFGEHQDYLHLPVVASAISLRISIKGRRRNDKLINIYLPNISSQKSFKLDDPIIYTEERDYFKSSLKVLLRHSFTFDEGFDCTVEGQIPINAGTSSSSALIVTWINFLTRMSDQSEVLTLEKLVRYSYEAEVLEFSEPGGMMDQYSTAFGGIISIDFIPEIIVTRLNTKLRAFVLGNSGEPKNTKFILSHVKDQILAADIHLKKIDSNFALQSISISELLDYQRYLSKTQFNLLEGTLLNRDITRLARVEMNEQNPDHNKIGTLLNEHQTVLRDLIGISTSKIDRMIKASLNAGAYGAKINGSGGGGCMFAYSPEDPERVKSAIESVGGKAFIIKTDSGSREEIMEEIKIV